MLDKNYTPSLFESSFYKKQELALETFKSNGDPYCIMMPPPNVTGNLHLGHALTYTLQDILIRYKRSKGFDVLWQPGTDHAGIATQMVVERNLAAEGIKRQEMGREKFLERVWAWKNESGNAIESQQRRLCVLPEWKRTRFTMDDGLSEWVRKVFVDLYKQNIIYRDKRLVNWDSKFQTAISDLEVDNKEVDGNLYYIRYTIDGAQSITVATTRPETMLGDQAIAVHPEDERYQHLIGKMAHLPLTNRQIPIIADAYCDKEKGSGAVKITPAHDFNDFEVGKRHNLALLNILDVHGHLNDEVPEAYRGLSISEARTKILSDLGDWVEKIEPIKHTVPFAERSGVEVQPFLTDQWYVDTTKLVEPALKAVQNGDTSFIPKQWENTYFEWLNNIQPWCISRQLWWGHQIPAWFGDDGKIFVALTEEEALDLASKHYGHVVTSLKRDEDVLDTWFSSALWPFSTLSEEEVKRYYPTSVLVTGFDIIFFWVARMMMMGLHFIKDVPFKDVYIHALVRDEKGHKMSKSKGNVIDPLILIDKFGSDALRFTLCVLSTPGRDIKLGEARVELNRNFITKIWNSARFLEMNNCTYDADFDPSKVIEPLNQWLIHELTNLSSEVGQHLDNYRFDLYATRLYQWFWGTYCDIFLESLKPMMGSKTEAECQKTAVYGYLTLLKLLHPVMPMVTDFLWSTFNPEAESLIVTPWPDDQISFQESHQKMQLVFGFAQEVRSIKGLMGVQAGSFIDLTLNHDLIMTHAPLIQHLARVKNMLYSMDKPSDAVPFVVGDISAYAHLVADRNEVKTLLKKKVSDLNTEIVRLTKKLENPSYKIAKPELWEEDNLMHIEKSKECLKISMLIDGF